MGIWLWKDSRALRTPEASEKFFGLCQDVGVAGVKIDFLDHEAKDVIDLYQVLLKEAAQHQLMVNFHGANKPSGESRTWPNEMTREGFGAWSAQIESRSRHNATLPFTRYLAGHGDYTPVVFGDDGATRRQRTKSPRPRFSLRHFSSMEAIRRACWSILRLK